MPAPSSSFVSSSLPLAAFVDVAVLLQQTAGATSARAILSDQIFMLSVIYAKDLELAESKIGVGRRARAAGRMAAGQDTVHRWRPDGQVGIEEELRQLAAAWSKMNLNGST